MKTWIYLVKPAFDSAFMAGADAKSRAIVDEHGDYLTELRQVGKLVLAGRCWDGPFGAIIFEAPDRAEAEAIVAGDPSVARGLQAAELYEFNMPYPPVSRGVEV